MGSERQTPQNVQFERLLLGGEILDPRRIAEIVQLVEPQDFHRPEHECLQLLLVEMWLERVPIDFATVAERVSRRADRYGGVPYVIELADRVPATANLDHYARGIRTCAERRRMIAAAQQLTEKLYDEPDYRPLVGAFMRDATEISRERMGGHGGAIYDVAAKEAHAYLEKAWSRKDGLAGVSSGFEDLDMMLSGFEPGTVTVLGARPSMGKSALALQITENIAVDGGLVAYCSLEMPKAQLALRSISRRAEIALNALKRGEAGGLGAEEFERYYDARDWVAKLPIHVEDASMSGPDLVAKVRALHQEHGERLKLVVVDYVQRLELPTGSPSRVEGVGANSTSLKNLALDLGLPVLAVAALNRGSESRRDHKPMMSDLRDSGAIESDADTVIFLHREGVYNDLVDPEECNVIVAKNRNGPIGDLKWTFKGKTATFINTEDGLSL